MTNKLLTNFNILFLAEVAAKDLPSSFVIGDGQATGPNKEYTNGYLLSSTKYSCFLRAFSKSSHLGQNTDMNTMRKLLQEAGTERQYAIFMSSEFMDVRETGTAIMYMYYYYMNRKYCF